MQKLVFCALMGIAVALAACNQGGPQGTKTVNGHTVKNHTNGSGAKIVPGDLIEYHMAVYVKDSMLGDTRTMGMVQKAKLPTADKLPTGRPVPVLYDGFQLMTAGDSATMYQNLDTLMSKDLPESLKDAKFVRYEVKVIAVKTDAEVKKEMEAAQAKMTEVEAKVKSTIASYKSGGLKDKLVTLESGLKLLIEEKGAGAPLKVGDQVSTHYYGALAASGNMFDNSYTRGEMLDFALGMGQMIPGFDEGAQQLNHGGRAFLFIPSKLGYGAEEQGPIPANSELVFYIDVK
jgi:FKBP-type peptidyl-prolyl cis-trans isomerase FkpA